jgi:uncharacterized DUF497 family protein
VAGGIEFDWDEANIEHIARHNLKPEEAEQVLENDPLELEPQLINGEERFPNIGVTNGGKWLVVIVTQRGIKPRVVTAFAADKDLITLYVREKREQR